MPRSLHSLKRFVLNRALPGSGQPGWREAYRAVASSMRRRTPMLFRLGQIVIWLLRIARRNKISSVLFLVSCIGACVLPLYIEALWGWRNVIWGLTALVFTGAVAAVLAVEAAGAIFRGAAGSIAKLEQRVAARDAEIRRLVQQLQRNTKQFARNEADRLVEAANREARAGNKILRAENEKNLAAMADVLRKERAEDKKQLTQVLAGVEAETKEVVATANSLKKELSTDKASIARLRERVAASEQQIGAMRYPDAPATLVFFGHHKCASRFFRSEVLTIAAEATGARVRKYEIKKPPFHYSMGDDLDLYNIDFNGLGENGRDVVLLSNATARLLARIEHETTDWKGLRILRDPRQVLVSDYFHHKGEHLADASKTLGWIWDPLVRDKPILQGLSPEEGLLYELDHITKQIIETQILCPFEDERVMTIKIEDFSNNPKAYLMQISQFLRVADIAGIDFKRTNANPESGPWQRHFTPRLRQVFKERYGQALIDLGYAEDFDW